MELYLKKLSKTDGMEVYELLQEIDGNDNGFRNEVSSFNFQEFKYWLERNENFSKGRELDHWMVPQTTFWLYRRDQPIGYGRIRHALNENLSKNSGHIGYALGKPYRGKGYGHTFLRLLLQECLEMSIHPIQIGVGIENIRSNQLVVANGGTLISVTKNKKIYRIFREDGAFH
ncbi:GNAT family N-acetyltransferase [Pseudalkalibacillus hwajinpoensis]|uniref:GNAT family N-acetyltransferase n=1 Tax=Guptibacillus hwajinpoensis TaxID=208199 RepID=UPI001CFC791F|nr:GNAT family N-acetyltransferase [Pseudalkalibacillus hwajinpoensis]